MSRLEVPLLGRLLRATGQIVLRAELKLWLRDAQNVLQSATFRVDSASEMTTMPAWRIPAVTLGWSFVVIHLVIAPLALPFRAAHPTAPKVIEERFYVRAALPPSVADQTVVIVNAPSPLHAGLLPLLRTLDGLPVPRHTRVLAPALPRVTVRRLDDRTLSIRPERGYLSWILDQLFRGKHQPLALGQKVVLTGMTVEITALTDDGRPAEATFRFDRPLEDASLYWLCYRDKGFEPFTPPAVGESVELRAGGLLEQMR